MKLRQIRKALKRNFKTENKLMFPYQACLVRNSDDEVWCLAILTEFKDDYGHPLFYIDGNDRPFRFHQYVPITSYDILCTLWNTKNNWI